MDFVNAYTFGFLEKRGFTQKKAWRHSLRLMAESTGCNAVILPVCAWQDHAYSTEIDSDHPDVISAEDVQNVCAYARELGLGIILKAMVNCRDGYWRAYIRFFNSDEAAWERWFASWTAHVERVAAMAAENRAEMLCVGCEMIGTEDREQDWRKLIRRARSICPGSLMTYNTDKYQEDHIRWWDALDVISSSGYYPIDDMERQFARIERLAQRERRPFMFMECGCPSRLGSEFFPYDWKYGKEVWMNSQRGWYEVFLKTLEEHPLIRGTGWWDWPATRLYPEFAGEDDGGYCTFGKPANRLLREFAERLKVRGEGLT